MGDAYANDPKFANVMSALNLGKIHNPYMLKDGFLLYDSRLCVTQALREKVMLESHAPPYASLFWKGLFENMGTRLDFSSTYHPQTDGQSEVVSFIVLDLLNTYVNDVDHCNQWDKYLPLLEYAYNNMLHISTGKAPFEVIKGRPKVPQILRMLQNIFAADEYVCDLQM